MDRSLKWRSIALAASILTCIGVLLPTVTDDDTLPSYFPFKKKINLGLDLQGGSHIVYSIDLDKSDTEANMTGRACKVSTAAVCQEAESHSDFAWIEGKIFAANCFGSSCHTGPTASGQRDLSQGNSYATLMGPTGAGGVTANLDLNHALVVPGDPANSYLHFIIRGVEASAGTPPYQPPPSEVGFMPMGNALLCCQKIDAIERWITAGALNN